jgi:hypothetical protein
LSIIYSLFLREREVLSSLNWIHSEQFYKTFHSRDVLPTAIG